MKADEKIKLLEMFDSARKWCQGSEARNQAGDPIRYDDPTAVSWDLVGGMCHLFGWRRASSLFRQFHDSIVGHHSNLPPNNEDIAAMSALIDFNDAENTSFESIIKAVQDMPVWTQRIPVETP